MIAPPDIVLRIQSSSGEKQLKYIRQLRNALVGHSDEKLEHAKGQTIPVLLDIVKDQTVDDANRTQAAITIASFSFGT